MELTEALRELAKFSAGEYPVISVYLTTAWRDQHHREEVMTFLTRHVRQARALEFESPEAAESLEQDLVRILEWGDRLMHRTVELTAPGMALFACSGVDMWLELPTPMAFEDAFIVEDQPALRQLVQLNEDYTNALVVLVDSRAARICQVVLGGLLTETAFQREFPGRHKQGGWAQMRYQRHVKEHMDQHHREVADYLATYVSEHPQTYIILSGQQDILANFRPFLSPPVQQYLIDEVHLDMRESVRRIVETAREVLEKHEREEEQTLVERLLNVAGRGGLGVLGVQGTLEATNLGKVHLLVLHRDFHINGWRCRDCGQLGPETVPQCTVCGGQVLAIDLGEALVTAVLRKDGFVEIIAPDPRLAAYEGVGALLRYT